MSDKRSCTLEMSLKPFKSTEKEYVRGVCANIFNQWRAVLKAFDTVKLLLWTGDGSELFDYTGNENDAFEWAYHIGIANRRGEASSYDEDKTALHTRSYKYMKNPPKMTYKILKEIVSEIKMTGKEFFPDKEILVGTTVDSGPEFAVSDFKYSRHEELCTGEDMGKASMLCAYEKMHADNYHYASYPNGVEEGTPFGTFFGKQATVFTRDMGFDYIWLSNGLGFGREVWSDKGAVFDGEHFNISALGKIREEVVDFWKLFRLYCPDLPVEVRGTNMSLGIDNASDGVPLKTIYSVAGDVLAPPNSPWAAINGNYGLELMGYMSRIAHTPNGRFLFRFYLHDIWWMNSPWYDRYNSMPHDIYLPLAISKIDESGNISGPTDINILSIDNSFGDMPDACANEVSPHLLKAIKESADRVAPIVWVYPFNEYSDASDEGMIRDMYFEDRFIEDAINEGLFISSVTASDSFLNHDKSIYASSVIITPVPIADSKFESEIVSYAKNGGKVIFYGSTRRSGKKFKELLKITTTDEVKGKLDFEIFGKKCGYILHNEMLSGGAICEEAEKENTAAYAGSKAFAVFFENYAWIRGSLCEDEGAYKSSKLFTDALARFGYEISFDAPEDTASPKMMIHRHNNAYIFSCHTPVTAVTTRMKFPLGAPILDGYSAKIENGYAVYNFPKSERKECRVFVCQQDGIVSVSEAAPVSIKYRRSIKISGLKDATVRIMAERYCADSADVYLKRVYDYIMDKADCVYKTDGVDSYIELSHMNGDIYLYMPFKENMAEF